MTSWEGISAAEVNCGTFALCSFSPRKEMLGELIGRSSAGVCAREPVLFRCTPVRLGKCIRCLMKVCNCGEALLFCLPVSCSD